MRREILLLIPFGIAACGSDYKVTAEPDIHGVDSAAPVEETGEPLDSAPPDPDAPVAVCEVYPNPVTPPREAATWDGSGSYDPAGGYIAGYDWRLISQPDGASMSIGGAGPTRGGFTPEIAGTYTAQLIVQNDSGVKSAPCTVDLEAIPSEDLWVELYWAKPRDDMDLHLLAPGAGIGALRSDQDCYFANCAGTPLNWGTAGPEDNPVLDLDDIPGTGPENINIEAPESGVYTVVVHDHTSNYLTEGNAATVNVYLDGSLVWTDTRTISGEDDYVPYAQIDYAARTVTGL